MTAVVTRPDPPGAGPKRRNPLQFVCDCVVSSYKTVVEATVAIIDESSKITSARGRYEDKLLTRSRHHPRTPKPERRRGSLALYSLVAVGWFGFTSGGDLLSDPVAAFQSTPGGPWVVAAYVVLTGRRFWPRK